MAAHLCNLQLQHQLASLLCRLQVAYRALVAMPSPGARCCCWLSWTPPHAAAVNRGGCHPNRCGCPAVGDIHGDLQKAVTALETAGVLTEHNQSVKWTGGNTVVVQLGDVLDRGDSEIGAHSASLIAQAARYAVAAVIAGGLSCTQEGTLG